MFYTGQGITTGVHLSHLFIYFFSEFIQDTVKLMIYDLKKHPATLIPQAHTITHGPSQNKI